MVLFTTEGGLPVLWPYRGAIIAVGLFAFFALADAMDAPVLPQLFPSKTADFFIIRSGSVIALEGQSPYVPQRVQAMVAEQYPTDAQVIANSAFFLPPETLPLLAPFAAMPYRAARVGWALLMIVSAAAVLLVLVLFGSSWPSQAHEQFLPLILLINYLTLVIVEMGQTSLISVGCVAAGQWFFERGGRLAKSSRWGRLSLELAGSLLWALPFVKPHVAVLLLPLAWYLGGWKRPLSILIWVFALNVIGCAMIDRSPLFLWEYVRYLGQTHKLVSFNRAEINPVITSWNRLLYTLGGPLIELDAWSTLAGYGVWLALVASRAALSGRSPSAAWLAASMAVGAVFCSQVLLYESYYLVLMIPWLRQLFAGGFRQRGWLTAGVLCLQLVPVRALSEHGIVFHHALAAALLAVIVLTGPTGDLDKAVAPGEYSGENSV